MKWIPDDFSKSLLDQIMNQIPDNLGDTMENQNTKTPQVILPNSDATIDSIEITSEQIEANIDRLLAEELGAPKVAAASFDAVAYASLSASEPPKPLDQPFGEADPYVNPAELTPTQEPDASLPPGQPTPSQLNTAPASELTNPKASPRPEFPAASTVDEILSRLPDYNPELLSETETIEPNNAEQVETKTAASITVEVSRSNDANSNRPTVEVIEPADDESTNDDSANESAETADPPLNATIDEPSPPVAWFAEGATPTETTGAPVLQDVAVPADAPPATYATPVPIADANPETGEPVYDVRDFGESATRTIEPIPGSYEVEPDAFDFSTAEELPTTNPANLTSDPEQVFMAGEGDVIQIDGNDGFDFIDLACFDVNSATFSENLIRINDDQGNAFEIRHQNVKHALFSDGVQVILASDESQD